MTEPINDAVRKHETGLQLGEWTQQVSMKEKVDLKALSEALYRFFDLFNKEFFPSLLPLPLITFKPTTRRALGHFRPGRNDIGAKLEVNINTAHLDRPLLLILKTLLHEMIHVGQYAFPDVYGCDSYRSNYHNMQFREKATALGIPSSNWGVTTDVDNPFKAFCLKHDVDGIQYRMTSDASEIGPSRRRSGRLQKWTCSCVPVYGVWVAVRHFSARCNICNANLHLYGRDPGLV